MRTVSCTVQEKTGYEIQITAVCCGTDLNVSVCGGQKHHIGAVAIAWGCMPDGSAPQYTPAVSSIACLNHKDDQVARKAAVRLAAAFRCTVVVTAGIHIDDATPQEIEILLANVEEGLRKLQELL